MYLAQGAVRRIRRALEGSGRLDLTTLESEGTLNVGAASANYIAHGLDSMVFRMDDTAIHAYVDAHPKSVERYVRAMRIAAALPPFVVNMPEPVQAQVVPVLFQGQFNVRYNGRRRTVAYTIMPYVQGELLWHFATNGRVRYLPEGERARRVVNQTIAEKTPLSGHDVSPINMMVRGTRKRRLLITDIGETIASVRVD